MFDFQQIEPGTGTHIEGNIKFMLFSKTNHTVYMLTLYKYRYIIENNVNTNGVLKKKKTPYAYHVAQS